MTKNTVPPMCKLLMPWNPTGGSEIHNSPAGWHIKRNHIKQFDRTDTNLLIPLWRHLTVFLTESTNIHHINSQLAWHFLSADRRWHSLGHLCSLLARPFLFSLRKKVFSLSLSLSHPLSLPLTRSIFLQFDKRTLSLSGGESWWLVPSPLTKCTHKQSSLAAQWGDSFWCGCRAEAPLSHCAVDWLFSPWCTCDFPTAGASSSSFESTAVKCSTDLTKTVPSVFSELESVFAWLPSVCC